jgi:hypothetical protein
MHARRAQIVASVASFTPAGCAAVTRAAGTILCMPDVAEITLRCRGARRLTAGFAGWDVERCGPLTVLRRPDATATDVHTALVEVGDLGLELESFRRLELST